jgi:hypothetical protein
MIISAQAAQQVRYPSCLRGVTGKGFSLSNDVWPERVLNPASVFPESAKVEIPFIPEFPQQSTSLLGELAVVADAALAAGTTTFLVDITATSQHDVSETATTIALTAKKKLRAEEFTALWREAPNTRADFRFQKSKSRRGKD